MKQIQDFSSSNKNNYTKVAPYSAYNEEIKEINRPLCKSLINLVQKLVVTWFLNLPSCLNNAKNEIIKVLGYTTIPLTSRERYGFQEG